jgi:hypothetical protein
VLDVLKGVALVILVVGGPLALVLHLVQRWRRDRAAARPGSVPREIATCPACGGGTVGHRWRCLFTVGDPTELWVADADEKVRARDWRAVVGLHPQTTQADFFSYAFLQCPTNGGALYHWFVPLELFSPESCELQGVLDANEAQELQRVLENLPPR